MREVGVVVGGTFAVLERVAVGRQEFQSALLSARGLVVFSDFGKAYQRFLLSKSRKCVFARQPRRRLMLHIK